MPELSASRDRSKPRTQKAGRRPASGSPPVAAAADARLAYGELALELMRLRALLAKRTGRSALAPFEVQSRTVRYLHQRTQQGATVPEVASELGMDLSQLCRWRQQQRQALEAGVSELSQAIEERAPGFAAFLTVEVEPVGSESGGDAGSSVSEAFARQRVENTAPPRTESSAVQALEKPVARGRKSASQHPRRLTLVTPRGYRVEGLSFSQLCNLLRRLSC